VLDWEGFVSHIALLFIVVHINFYIWGNRSVDRSHRGVCCRGRKVMQRMIIDCGRYTIDAVVNGKQRLFVAVDGVVDAVGSGVTGRMRVAHEDA
jgi:hypothetical protein